MPRAASVLYATAPAPRGKCDRALQSLAREANALAKSLERGTAQISRGRARRFARLTRSKGLVEHAASEFGRLDGLVNNASTFTPLPMGRIDEDQWIDLIDSNLKAPLFLSQAAKPCT